RVDDGELRRQMHCWSEQGLRVLLFAHAPDVVNFHNMAGELEVPALTPLALISLRDELRPQVRETVAEFARLGIDLKVISGDSPFTVAALAKQAGLPDGIKLVSGPELAEMSTAAFEEAVTDATIFGRVSPQQKEQIVTALQQRGRHVAMIGDGVNDVLSLKKASIGIAMQSGSNATRNVADMILLDDSFAALRPAFHEGQRIVAGMSNILYLFLARSLTTMLVIIGVMTVGLPFPFDPAQVALTTFTVGIPAFFLTLWARPRKVEPDILLSLARFAIPVALLTMLMGVGLYLNNFQRASTAPVDVENAADHRGIPDKLVESYSAYTGVDPTSPEFGTAFGTIAAQGALSIFISHTAFLLILFLEPPFRFFTGWRTHVSKDKRPALLALALVLLFQIFYFVPTIGGYFGLLEKPPTVYLRILVLVVVWMFAMRTIWRHHLFDRFLGLDFQPK
ncbi:MAG: HAD-IC family P-type ATPase, partial [Caldilineaceae bacterium]